MASAVEPWGGYQNGRIPLSALRALSWAGNQYLKPSAASEFERLNAAYRARFGVSMSELSAYRTYEQQVILKRSKPDLAAPPGTSNHGWGLAVDIGGGVNDYVTTQHQWMRQNATTYGWFIPAWARENGSKREPWHWEFNESSGSVVEDEDEPREVDMKIIQAPGRGIAVVGAGYYRLLANTEEVNAAVALIGSPMIGTDRQFDVWRFVLLAGEYAGQDRDVQILARLP